jgi:signal transduction histidine kinase
MTSLRRRILLGSLLWTVGMIVVASALFSLLMEVSPHARLAVVAHVHGTLQAPLILSAAVLCLVTGALQVRRGLRRIDDLRTDLARLHQGNERRLHGAYPSEVQPLADEVNALLERRDAAVRNAVGKAGDLAHGLKTPLAVLTRDAESAERAGHHELAASMRQQIDRMRRQIDYHLAHARAVASGPETGVRSPVQAAVEGIVRALQRIQGERAIAVSVECPETHQARVQREDLDEMLGNLLENAFKWAQSRVVVRSAHHERQLVVTIDDDGRGIAEALRADVLRRGVRADEATRGSGLGLAIVRDLADAYGGSIELEASPTGGCRAVLRLPSVSTEPPFLRSSV